MTPNPNMKTVCDNCSAQYIVKHDLPDDYIEQFKPFDFASLEIIMFIEIGDFLSFENLIRDNKLLPVPEIKTAVLILLVPVDRAI